MAAMRFQKIMGLACCVLALAGHGVWAASPCPQVMRVGFINSPLPPYIQGAGADFEDPPGLLVGWIREAVKRSQCAPYLDLRRYPLGPRGRIELSEGRYDVASLIGDVAENTEVAVLPMRNGKPDLGKAILNISYSLYVRRGDKNMQWSGTELLGPPGFKVGVSRARIPQMVLERNAWAAEVGPGSQNVLDMLIAGRTAVALLPDSFVTSMPAAARANLERLGPVQERTWYFSGVGKEYYAKYPDFVHRYWTALCHIARADQKDLPACR